jgi:hypothetical protein
MMPLMRPPRPNPARPCRRSSPGKADAHADAGSTHGMALDSAPLAAAKSLGATSHPYKAAPHAGGNWLSAPATAQPPTPLSP